jgi:hypothetical protein
MRKKEPNYLQRLQEENERIREKLNETINELIENELEQEKMCNG